MKQKNALSQKGRYNLTYRMRLQDVNNLRYKIFVPTVTYLSVLCCNLCGFEQVQQVFRLVLCFDGLNLCNDMIVVDVDVKAMSRNGKATIGISRHKKVKRKLSNNLKRGVT
jgi:hypothetical protein